MIIWLKGHPFCIILPSKQVACHRRTVLIYIYTLVHQLVASRDKEHCIWMQFSPLAGNIWTYEQMKVWWVFCTYLYSRGMRWWQRPATGALHCDIWGVAWSVLKTLSNTTSLDASNQKINTRTIRPGELVELCAEKGWLHYSCGSWLWLQ